MVSLAPLLSLPCLADDLARVEKALLATVRTGDPFLAEVASPPDHRRRQAPAARPWPCAVGELGGGPGRRRRDHGRGARWSWSTWARSTTTTSWTRPAPAATSRVVNARWGNLVAILAGDFLLARASEIAASLGTEVAGLLAATIGRLCEGQVRELAQTFDVTRTEEAYLTSIAGKTAALMATACRIGAITAGLDRPGVEALTAYGEQVGMVFQIVDDILDVVATDEELGKPAGNDLVEGVYTLPVIRALAVGRVVRAAARAARVAPRARRGRRGPDDHPLQRGGRRRGRRGPPLRRRVGRGPGRA